MQNVTKLILLTTVLAVPLLTGCAESRHEALERRQDGYDARHSHRTERRELRSDRADARNGHTFDSW